MGLSSAGKFKWDMKSIPMPEIDLTDRTCHLGLFVDSSDLVDSIQAVGLINAPILRQRQDRKYRIVCGFRRLEACKTLGWQEVESRVIMDGLSDLETLKLAVLDNRSHRQLHVVEQARGIQKLSPLVSSRNRLRSLASLIGFPENPKVFAKLEALSRLPERIQVGVMEETISFEAAVLLSEFSDDDGAACFDMLMLLRLSQNKETEVITWIKEIAVREDTQPGEVVGSEAVGDILAHPDLNRNEKGSRLRDYLKKRRFPTLAQAEEKFSRETKALKLNGHIHMTAPPRFEGGPYTLRMTFKTLEDFKKRLKTLRAMADNPALKRLLKPFD